MQREIKFRAFDNGEMVYSNPMPDFSFWKWSGYSNTTILMQYTGQEDINGTEIYESEIIFNDDRKENCVVKYDQEKAMFIVEYVETKDKFPLWESISNLYYSIGNIYEQPELLNK